ncbi:hypothetical protein ILUMI_03572 [Ignelater luminosus]|uniref:Uncharacterized protein n=1 Tax=Ignelater luminosus TaxID=2038154 RepID=A0A8K0DAJ0_IGNLU|nr:hypothetical protein ILUMI_03572 [Ignelater luminosus]
MTALPRQAKEFVASLVSYFERERDNGGPLILVTAVREESTCIIIFLPLNYYCSLTTVNAKSGEPLRSLKKTKRREKPIIDIDDFDQDAIRNTRGLMELPNITLARVRFLQEYVTHLRSESGRQCIVLEETWIFENGTVCKSWQDDNAKSVRKIKPEGRRNKPAEVYDADRMALEHGHVVVRLPPYYCIFNPIENFWGEKSAWPCGKKRSIPLLLKYGNLGWITQIKSF